MTHPPRATPAVVWGLVAGFAILVAGFVALYALAPPNAKPNIGPVFGAVAIGLPAFLAALGAWVRGARTHELAVSNNAKLDKITEQTNGALDQRIRDAVTGVFAETPGLVGEAVLSQGLAKMLQAHVDAPASPRPRSSTRKPAAKASTRATPKKRATPRRI